MTSLINSKCLPSQPALECADEHQAAAEQQQGEDHGEFEQARSLEPLGEQREHHHSDRGDQLESDHRVGQGAAGERDSGGHERDEHGDRGDDEAGHRSSTSWWVIMTSRSGSMPSTNSFGARLRAPVSSTRRVTPSGVLSPYLTGSSRKRPRGSGALVNKPLASAAKTRKVCWTT